MVSAFRQFIGRNAMMAYLVMMAPRLVELRRVLKPTGSYLPSVLRTKLTKALQATSMNFASLNVTVLPPSIRACRMPLSSDVYP